MEKQATFKKAMFGFEKESVVAYIDALYNESRDEIAALNEKINTLKLEKQTVENEKSHLKETIDGLTKSLEDCETRLESEKSNSLRFADGLRSMNGEINRLKLDVSHKDYKINELTGTVADYESRMAQLKEKVGEGEEIIQLAKQKAEALLEKTKQECALLIQEAKNDRAELDRTISDKKAEIEHLNQVYEDNIQGLKEKVSQMMTSLTRMTDVASIEEEDSEEVTKEEKKTDINPAEEEETRDVINTEEPKDYNPEEFFFRSAATD